MKYPIKEIYPTIQGEGIWTGCPITLIRFGMPEEVDFLHLTPQDKEPYTLMSIDDISVECSKYKPYTLHITGNEPALSNLTPLLKALRKRGFMIWMDTSGSFPIENKALISHLSVGPKPGIPLIWEVVNFADELRLYWDDEGPWEDNIHEVVSKIDLESGVVVTVIPKNFDKLYECMEVTRRCLTTYGGDWRMIPPLYLIFPNFDGSKCKICVSKTVL